MPAVREIRDIYLRREPGPFGRSGAALVLRLGLGLMLAIQGYSKYDQMRKAAPAADPVAESTDPDAPRVAEMPADPRAYPNGMIARFGGNFLEDSLLSPERVGLFARVLPYAEMAIGVGLVLGLLTGLWGLLAGLLLVMLLFGRVVLSVTDPAEIAALPGMFSYLFAAAGILWLSPVTSNYFSLDGLIFGWFFRKNNEAGEFRPDR